MRYALLADIHSNLEALGAVLGDLANWPSAQIVCAGDLVGYGPDPDACVAVLTTRGALAVAGNHEGMVLGRIGFARCVHAGIRAAVWTASVLGPVARELLAALPATLELPPDIVVCHGSLDDPEHYVSTARRADEVLRAFASRYSAARLLVVGHTHHRMLYRSGEPWQQPVCNTPLRIDEDRWLINPGSVGQSRDGRPSASYARYDSSTRTLEFRELAYDYRRTQHKQRRAGLVARVDSQPAQGIARHVERARTRWARWRARLPSL